MALLPYLNSAVFSALLFFVFYIYLNKKHKKNENPPPAVSGGWPIIGHLPLLSGTHQLPHRVLGDLADKYGPIFTIRLGLSPAVVISSHELAKELFTTNDISVSSRPPLTSVKLMVYGNASFGFTPYGSFWRDIRKIVSVELLSARRLQLLNRIRVTEVEESVRELYKNCMEEEEKKNSKSGGGVLVGDIKNLFGDINLNVILKMVTGKRHSLKEGEEKSEGIRCKQLFRDFFYLFGQFLLGDAVPFLGFLDFGGFEKTMKNKGREVDLLMSELLDEHKRRKRDFGDEEGDKDFMDVLISSLEGGGVDLAGFDADTINKATCMALIAGGSDTTTVTLTWTIALLLKNPSVLQKAHEELDKHVGKDRRVEEDDINDLTYLKSIVKEAMRLHPAAALSGPRQVTNDCTINGYKVRAGTRLIVNLWKLQQDPRVWGDPTEFRPDRFIKEHKDVDVKGKNFELIPFGAGRRICPGWGFAHQMIHLVLATLIHAFDMSTIQVVDMSETAGLTNAKATPLPVFVKPRLYPFPYA